MKKPIIILLSISIMSVAIILGAGVYIYKNILNINTIYKGIKIDGHIVENKTKEEALEFIKEIKENEIHEKYMNLLYGGRIYKIGLKQLGFSYDYDNAINRAFQLGREGNFIRRLRDIKKLKKGTDISLDSFYDEGKLENISNDISREINIDAIDAKINLDRGKIIVTDHVIGKKVVLEDLVNAIDKNIYELKDIEIPVKDITPNLTKEFLSRINGVIGQYSTSFKGSSAGRVENIRLSAKAISNKLILPGQEFSYNNTTGPRTQESGYKEANVIIGGELTPGLGGGVCQTSTTMYNALLLADLTILERSPHSIPASYVPYGQDAAVSYGYLDLKFRNDFDFPIYTYAKTINNEIFIYIYGDINAKNYQVKINPQIVETISPKTEEVYDGKLAPGEKINVQKGRTGYKVNTYKSIIKNGKVISEKQITTDHYRKKDYIYKIGPSLPINSNN